MRNARFSIRVALMAVVMLALAPFVFGQVTGAIQGTIYDPSGAAVAGASVKVTNEATGVARTGETEAEGHFRIPDLLAGTYEIQVAKTGFKTLVRKSIELAAESVLNIDLKLNVGDSSETVEVVEAVPQVETTEARISEVYGTQQLESLPVIGRGLTFLALIAPGVIGKAEDSRSGNCCDALSSFGSPMLSSGTNQSGDSKAAFYLDGVSLHYGDYGNWNLAFTPNLDAIAEMRVSSNPTSVEQGILAGPQVQMVTKGGTNALHGTAHYTFLQDTFNALPYEATKADVGSWYQRYFGGTVGGPVIKNRLFFFFAYEGLRQLAPAAAGQSVIVETQAFANWVETTRPNSIAAQLLKDFPPFKYATDNLVDVNGDGIPDLGTVSMDRKSPRSGNQYNGRVDYLTRSGRDRLYATFWRTMESIPQLDVRPNLDYQQNVGATFFSGVSSHTFTPTSLNEFRFSTFDEPWLWKSVKNSYNIPCIQTDDGLGFPSTFSGACNFMYENWYSRVYDVQDTYLWNHSKHAWKFGGGYRRTYATDALYLYGDIPVYNFATVIDFADDNPYQETRAVDPSTGKQRNPNFELENHMYYFFAQDSWQARAGLTINLGLRWDYYDPLPLAGIHRPTVTYAPLFTSDEVNPQGMLAVRNQLVTRSYNPDYKNFGPRISVAWDPKKDGRMAIRGGFFLLYNQLDSVSAFNNYIGNPPSSSIASAGSQYGIPIVYGIAPAGTRDFPINPGFVGGTIDPALGIYTGTRPDLYGYAKDFTQPRIYDANVAFQRQLFSNMTATVSYHYQHTPNGTYGFDANRVSGDVVDGTLDRLNPYYGAINVVTNEGRSSYQGFVFEVSKRLAQGWQLNASYNYNNNRGYIGSEEVFDPQVDWGRNEVGTHNFKLNAVWDLPFLRSRKDLLGTLLGGWQVSTIWNFISGGYFDPMSFAPYGSGGDFNADGQNADRPDLPTTSVARSFSKADWMQGAMSASIFPLPQTVRDGTLPANYFNGPGYARVDASFAKGFPIKERAMIQFQVQASNLLNRVNISSVDSSLTSITFAQANDFYPMRTVQMSIKCIF